MNKPKMPERFARIGMPATIKLDRFGSELWEAFDTCAILVGSAMVTKRWRDVDIRVILDDKVYAAMGLGDPDQALRNGKWCALVSAFSALGKEMTGLPIDFQIQQMSHANRLFRGKPRSAIGLIPLRWNRTTRTKDTHK